MTIYKCKICGNTVVNVGGDSKAPTCCGQEMTLLTASRNDAEASEKHVPIIKRFNSDVSVTVGDVLHPMTNEHHIEWVILETTQGFQIAYLNGKDKPVAHFKIGFDDDVKAAYAYCNLHGLWMTDFVSQVGIEVEEYACMSCRI